MPKIAAPITPAVLTWAIAESGLSPAEVAAAAKVPLGTFEAWQRGEARPGLTQLRYIAKKLHRPFAAFFLPEPPKSGDTGVEFRHPPGTQTRPLNAVERRYLRRARRMQRVLAWLSEELDEPGSSLSKHGLHDDPKEVAAKFRKSLGVTINSQRSWRSASRAFDAWREAIEARHRISVFLFRLGDGAWGFSLWDERAPAVAVSTKPNDEARVFTLFHEVGHLLTRTSSACVEVRGPIARPQQQDPTERWCQEFAGAVLMPEDAVRQFVAARTSRGLVDDVSDVRRLARQFSVSLRAVTLRLIELRAAGWDLYKELPEGADFKKPQGGGGGGRKRWESREDELGKRTSSMFHRAVSSDVLSRSQALDYLDVPDSDFEHLETLPLS